MQNMHALLVEVRARGAGQRPQPSLDIAACLVDGGGVGRIERG